MEKKSIGFNYIMNLIRTLLTIIFPLVTLPYVSRILLADGIGKSSFVISIISYFQLLASLGVNVYAITEGAKLRDDTVKLNHFATEVFTINLVSTTVSYLLLFLTIQMPFFDGYKTFILISSISIIFNTLGVEWLYSIFEEYKYITIRTLVMQIVSFILLFTLVQSKDDISQYLAVTSISVAGTGILNFIQSKKYITLFSEPLKKYNFKKHLKPIFILFAMSISVTIYVNSDITMLGLLKDDIAVGLYTVSVKIIKILCSLIGALSFVLLPRLSYYIANNKEKDYKDLLAKSMNFMLIFIVPGVIGLFLLSEEILTTIFGKAFMESVLAMKIMSLNLFLSPINSFFSTQILVPNNKAKSSLIFSVSGAIINVLLNFLIIPRYSHNGAAITTIIAEGIVFIMSFYYIKRTFNDINFFKDIWQYIVASIPIYFVYYLVRGFGIQNNLIVIIFTVLLSMFQYMGALLLLKNPAMIELMEALKLIIKKD